MDTNSFVAGLLGGSIVTVIFESMIGTSISEFIKSKFRHKDSIMQSEIKKEEVSREHVRQISRELSPLLNDMFVTTNAFYNYPDDSNAKIAALGATLNFNNSFQKFRSELDPDLISMIDEVFNICLGIVNDVEFDLHNGFLQTYERQIQEQFSQSISGE